MTTGSTSLCARVTVRHRAPGHLRLQLPEELRRQAAARYLTRGLEELPGVRRVALDWRDGKLAIHYSPFETSDRRLAVALAALLRPLTEPPTQPEPSPPPGSGPGWRERLLEQPLVRAARKKYTLWRARAAVAKVYLEHRMEAHPALQVFGGDPETAVINFLNEVVTFYLIKTHWNRITQLWMRHPFLYYKEWLALFYLVFLLVRSRRHDSQIKRLPHP